MNTIKRNRTEILNYLSWVLVPAFLFRKEIIAFVHGNFAYHNLNPVDLLWILIGSFMIGYPVIESYWAYKNPFARIEAGLLVICPRPFNRETIKISDIKKVRESLTHGSQKIFGFNSKYTTWVLMVDLLNSMTITIPLHQKNRVGLMTLLADNNIAVESDKKE